MRVDPAGAQDPVRALRAAATVGPYFAVAVGSDGTPGWRPAADLYGDPAVLAGLVGRVRERLGTPETRVAASILFQGWAARLWSVGLAVLVHTGRLPVLTPAALRWRDVGGTVYLGVEHPELGPGSAERLGDLVVGRQLEPLAAAVRRGTPMSGRVLWGNAASALRGAARVFDNGPAGPATALADEVLARDGLRGTLDATGRRRSCCLYYRVPGGGLCGDCVLAR
ncbi:MAG: transporter [Mycobacterium sp.]|nr:transporter [Mycobacterium sp.]